MASNGKKRSAGPHVTGSKEARRLSAVILEVMAGLRTPTEAAGTLGVSPPRYYALETRALQGLVNALEPREKGRTASPEVRAKRFEQENARLSRECVRYQALARAAQRTAGVFVTSPETQRKKTAAGKKRVKKPTVRALRVAKVLQSESEAEERA